MTVWVETDLCDGCRRCLKACVYDAITVEDNTARIGDRCTVCGACIAVCRQGAIATDAVPREVPDFSDHQGVWVFAEQRDGVLGRVSLELLGKAIELAGALNQKVAAVLLGHQVGHLSELLIAHGADMVYLADHPLLDHYRTLAYTKVITDLVTTHKPAIFLLGATCNGRDLAPRVSRRVGSGLTADCTELTVDPDEKILLQTRPAFGGNVMATIANRFSRPQMATVRPGVMRVCPVPGHTGTVVAHAPSLDEAEIGTRVLEVVAEGKRPVNLAAAKVLVAGGRGVGDTAGMALLRELADALDAEIAGTRVAMEAGWIPSEQQVGQTGQTVRPELYIACGISGAVQHRAGMADSRFIVAINRDPYAPIFKVADWGVVGDLFEVVPALTRQIAALRKGRDDECADPE